MKKTGKSVLSVLLTLALLLTLAPALGGTARAENAFKLYIAGKTGAAYGYEEEVQGYEWGNWVYQEGYTELSDGDSVSYGNSYANGARATYTRSPSGSSTLELSGYLTHRNVGYEYGTNLYGIYYDGNLTIQVYDECVIEAYRSGSFTNVYGVYVTGDLTIELHNGSSLGVNMGVNNALTAANSSVGIYSGGNLTIRNVDDTGSPRVEARGGRATATSDTKRGVSAGVMAGAAASLVGDNWLTTVRNGVVSVGEKTTLAARGGNVDGYCNNIIYPSASFGISAGTVTVGGTLTATAGEVTFDNDKTGGVGTTSCGVWATEMTVGAGACATVTGGSAKGYVNMLEQSSYGARLGTLNASGTLNATAGQAYKDSVGFYAQTVNLHTGAAVTAQSDYTYNGHDVGGSGSRGAEMNALIADGGSLTATGAATVSKEDSVGVKLGSCTLTGGATVRGVGGQGVFESLTVAGFTTTPGGTNPSYGVYVMGDTVSIGSGCTLSGEGGEIVSQGNSTPFGTQSVGVCFYRAVTVSGGGTLRGTGGVCNYAHGERGPDESCGIYAPHVLTVTGVTVEAVGNTAAAKKGNSPSCTGGRSFGLYIDDDAVFTNCAVTATGGDTLNHATTAGLYVADESYGAFVTGTLTLADATMTATGGSAEVVRGLHAGALALSGGGAALTAEAPEYVTDGKYNGRGAYGVETTSPIAVTEGKLTAAGASAAITGTTDVDAPVIEGGDSCDGSDAAAGSYKRYWRYAVLDAARAVVSIYDWTYGEYAQEPYVQNLEKYGDGSVTAAFDYTPCGEEDWSADAPVNAGDYTVRATLSNGVTGTADFTVARRGVTIRARDQVVPLGGEIKDGLEQIYLPSDVPLDGHSIASITLTPSSVDSVTTNGTVTPSDAVIEDADGKDVTANYDIAYKPGRLIVKGSAPMLACELRWGDTLLWTAVNAPAGAKLIAARYDHGRMTDVQIVALDAGDTSGTLTMDGSGDEYRLLLVDGATFAPLCPAWENERK